MKNLLKFKRSLPRGLFSALLLIGIAVSVRAQTSTIEPLIVLADGSYTILGESPDSRLMIVAYGPIGSIIDLQNSLWMLDTQTGDLQQIFVRQPLYSLPGPAFWIDADTIALSYSRARRSPDWFGTLDLNSGLFTGLFELNSTFFAVTSRVPDSDAVVVSVERIDGRSYDVYTYDLETRERAPLVVTETRTEINPLLSPDGRYLAFRGLLIEPQGVYTLDLASDTQIFLDGFQGERGDFDWSPDGEWLLFNSLEGEQPGLFLAQNRAGGARYRILDDVSLLNITWAFSGDYLAYTTWPPIFIDEPPGYLNELHIVSTESLGLALPLDMEALDERYERLRPTNGMSVCTDMSGCI